MSDDLWFYLANETFRQRGEGFQRDWSFHMQAARQRLGAPLARSLPLAQQIRFGNQTYGYQAFAGDLLYNPSTLWRDVRSLKADLQSQTPAVNSLAYQLLRHAYRRCIAAGNPPVGISTHVEFERGWKFHQEAIRANLGMALSGNYTISPSNNLLVALQVFAGDTLYSVTPPFRDVLRLSSLTPNDPLYHPLWFETYKVSQAVFGNESFGFNPHFHEFARSANLGAPLSDYYRGQLNTTPYDIQVFAKDTLYAPLGGPILRWSELPQPQAVQEFVLPVGSGGNAGAGTPGEQIPGTLLRSQWLADHPNTPAPIRKLITLALRVLHQVTDAAVLPTLTVPQRAQMRGDTNIVCADLVSMCLKTAGVNLSWTVIRPPGTRFSGDRAANYYRPEADHPMLRQVASNENWLPGDILVYKDFFQPVAGWLPDEYHHVVIYVGHFYGNDRLLRPYPPVGGYSVVSSSINDTKTNGIKQVNATNPTYFSYGKVVRVRHLQIEQMYRDAGMI